MSTIMRTARMFAGNGMLAVGKSVRQSTPAGTVIEVFNCGKGVFKKVVKKSNGDKFTSFFGKKEGLLKVSGENARGSWTITPDVPIEKNSTTGDVLVSVKQLEAKVNGLKGQYKTYSCWTNEPNADSYLYRYLVKQEPKTTFNKLASKIFGSSKQNNDLIWSA